VYEPHAVSFKCGCSREKTEAALTGMDKDSLLAQIQEQGAISVDCQFCKTTYKFGADDINTLFG
jgi:molecular chaperone Hsp33